MDSQNGTNMGMNGSMSRQSGGNGDAPQRFDNSGPGKTCSTLSAGRVGGQDVLTRASND